MSSSHTTSQFDLETLGRWLKITLAGLTKYETHINALNVYPVADADTGTNLLTTARAIVTEFLAIQADAKPLPLQGSREVLARAARAGLLEAYGSSGVIFAQWLAGFAEGVDNHISVSLSHAAARAYEAVAQPVEGTMLTVAQAAAIAARAPGQNQQTQQVAEQALQRAQLALAATPHQLDALAHAEVVDSGGQGLVIILTALVAAIAGKSDWPQTDSNDRFIPDPMVMSGVSGNSGDIASNSHYEVQYLLDAETNLVSHLREQLLNLGESLLVGNVGSENGASLPTWHIHIHTCDIGAVIEAGLLAGRVYQIRVTPLKASPYKTSQADSPTVTRALIVTAEGDGLVELFTTEGAIVISQEITQPEIVATISQTKANQVVLFPNNEQLWHLAENAAQECRQHGIAAAVVHTKSPVQALAALAICDQTRRFDADVVAMAEAASATRWAEIVIATRPAYTIAGRCDKGDVLGLAEGEVVFIENSIPTAAPMLLDRLLAAGGELVTVLLGRDAPDGLGQALATYTRVHWPYVELRIYEADQPKYPVMLGVE